MELSVFVDSLRDPMGLPFFPVVFQGLMVLTFALHIFMVNVVVGSLVLALWGRLNQSDFWSRLSRTLAKVATIGLSIAVVLGVAPLLFVQVIYDPFWYSANVLSAWWAMLFLLCITIGFLAAYALYLWHERRPAISLKSGLISVVTIIAAGVVIHMLNMELLAPQQWAEWFSGSGSLATSGWAFHEFNLGRFGHFMTPAIVNVGVFLMLYGWFIDVREESDPEFTQWVSKLGGGMARFGMVLQMAFGLWWLFELPGELDFIRHPGFHLGATVAVVAIGLMFWATSRPPRRALLAALISFSAVLIMVVTRESLRVSYLGQVDYSIYDYPVRLDWGSTLLFLGTFVGGLVVLAYPLLVAFKAGRGEKV